MWPHSRPRSVQPSVMIQRTCARGHVCLYVVPGSSCAIHRQPNPQTSLPVGSPCCTRPLPGRGTHTARRVSLFRNPTGSISGVVTCGCEVGAACAPPCCDRLRTNADAARNRRGCATEVNIHGRTIHGRTNAECTHVTSPRVRHRACNSFAAKPDITDRKSN